MERILYYCITDGGNYRALDRIKDDYIPVLADGQIAQSGTLCELAGLLRKSLKRPFILKKAP